MTLTGPGFSSELCAHQYAATANTNQNCAGGLKCSLVECAFIVPANVPMGVALSLAASWEDCTNVIIGVNCQNKVSGTIGDVTIGSVSSTSSTITSTSTSVASTSTRSKSASSTATSTSMTSMSTHETSPTPDPTGGSASDKGSKSDQQTSNLLYIIIGSVAGGVVLLSVLMVTVFLCRKRRHERKLKGTLLDVSKPMNTPRPSNSTSRLPSIPSRHDQDFYHPESSQYAPQIHSDQDSDRPFSFQTLTDPHQSYSNGQPYPNTSQSPYPNAFSQGQGYSSQMAPSSQSQAYSSQMASVTQSQGYSSQMAALTQGQGYSSQMAPSTQGQGYSSQSYAQPSHPSEYERDFTGYSAQEMADHYGHGGYLENGIPTYQGYFYDSATGLYYLYPSQ